MESTISSELRGWLVDDFGFEEVFSNEGHVVSVNIFSFRVYRNAYSSPPTPIFQHLLLYCFALGDAGPTRRRRIGRPQSRDANGIAGIVVLAAGPATPVGRVMMRAGRGAFELDAVKVVIVCACSVNFDGTVASDHDLYGIRSKATRPARIMNPPDWVAARRKDYEYPPNTMAGPTLRDDHLLDAVEAASPSSEAKEKEMLEKLGWWKEVGITIRCE